MPTVITRLEVSDVRFPTSRTLAGSDAMHPDPDYSAAYVILATDSPGLEGHGLTFTIGRGNELCVAAIHSLAPFVVGQRLEDIVADFGRYWERLANDGQLRWVGPEKGVLHLATAAVINALWDLWARAVGKPVWKLLSDLSPEEIVRLVPFRHISDALTPDEALAILRRQEPTRAEREQELLRQGYPCYTTSAGWLGYSDAQVAGLTRQAIAQGFTAIKMKVGQDLAHDRARARLLRDIIGPERKLMMDANQRWDVPQAIAWVRELAEFAPWWIEEPTHPDDVLGHKAIAEAIAPIGVATGEHVANRVLFKQLLTSGAIKFCQIDACRLGGVNEVIAVLLLAAKFGVPVCPHAGGVGLCEYVQHLSMFDFIAVSGTMENRMIEHVDHLHEHFVDPVVVRNARYLPPERPGYSIEMKRDSLEQYRYPDGPVWQELLAQR